MKELVEIIAKSLVDSPDLVVVTETTDADTITIDDAAKDKEHDGETFLVNKGKIWRGWNE